MNDSLPYDYKPLKDAAQLLRADEIDLIRAAGTGGVQLCANIFGRDYQAQFMPTTFVQREDENDFARERDALAWLRDRMAASPDMDPVMRSLKLDSIQAQLATIDAAENVAGHHYARNLAPMPIGIFELSALDARRLESPEVGSIAMTCARRFDVHGWRVCSFDSPEPMIARADLVMMRGEIERLQRMKDAPAASGAATLARWPWGNHSTELLEHLAAAADRYWKNYDPSDPTTAPKKEDVVKFLAARGVKPTNANAIAVILRPSGLSSRASG
jgi:hypothetical protein